MKHKKPILIVDLEDEGVEWWTCATITTLVQAGEEKRVMEVLYRYHLLEESDPSTKNHEGWLQELSAYVRIVRKEAMQRWATRTLSRQGR